MKTFIVAVIAISCTLSELPASMAATVGDPLRGETNFVKPTALSDEAKKCLKSKILNFTDQQVKSEENNFLYLSWTFNEEFKLNEINARFARACFSRYGVDLPKYADLRHCMGRLKLNSQFETTLSRYYNFLLLLRLIHNSTVQKEVLQCSRKSDLRSNYELKVLTKNGAKCAKTLLDYDPDVNNLDTFVYNLHVELNYFMKKYKTTDDKKVVHDDGKEALSFCFFQGELIRQAALPANQRFNLTELCVKTKVKDAGLKDLRGIIERFANTLDPYADKQKLIGCVLKK